MKYYKDENGTIFGWSDEQAPFIPKTHVLLTEDEVQAHFNPPQILTDEVIENGIDEYINSVAKSRGYDSIVSACSYAGYPNAFQVEAIALGTWRSSVWETAYAIMGKIKAGEMEMPKTLEEGIEMLPKFEG